MQQQRESVRAFRRAIAARGSEEQAANRRYESERQRADGALAAGKKETAAHFTAATAEAEKRFKAEQVAADARLRRVRQHASEHLTQATRGMANGSGTARDDLIGLGLESLLNERRPIPVIPHGGDEAETYLARSAVSAEEASAGISRGIKALQEYRTRRRRRRRTLAVSFTTLVFLAGAATYLLIWFLPNWRLEHFSANSTPEQLYQSALHAMDTGRWPVAAEAVFDLTQKDPAYKDMPARIVSGAQLRAALAQRPYQRGARVLFTLNPGDTVAVNGLNLSTVMRARDTCASTGFSFEVAAANTSGTFQNLELVVSGKGEIWGGSPPQDGCYSSQLSRVTKTVMNGETASYGFRELNGSGPTVVLINIGSLTVGCVLR